MRETPYIDLEIRSLRTAVIELLSRETSLSAKEIFEHLVLNNKNISYPAVYKTLKMLTREKKLLKHNRKFSVNINWIKELKKLIDTIERNSELGSLPPFEHFQKENVSGTYYFKNYDDADKYRKELQWNYLKEKRPVPYCGLYKHFKTPVTHSGQSVSEVKHLKDQKITTFLAVSSDTSIDRWCAKFYMRNPRISCKTGVSIPFIDVCETMILGDVIVQIYTPDNLQKLIESIYGKTKSIDDIDVLEFYESIYKTPAKIKIVVFNNKHIADIMRKQVLGYFGKKA